MRLEEEKKKRLERLSDEFRNAVDRPRTVRLPVHVVNADRTVTFSELPVVGFRISDAGWLCAMEEMRDNGLRRVPLLDGGMAELDWFELHGVGCALLREAMYYLDRRAKIHALIGEAASLEELDKVAGLDGK